MSVDLLVQKIKEKGNPSVAGLDPKIEYVPEYIRKKAYAEYGQNLKGATEAIWEFNKGLIDALYDVVPAVKPQSAFYEMYGLCGEEVMHRTISYAKEKGLYIILDVKRNDIGSTAEAYSKAYLGKVDIDGVECEPCPVDCVTVNPYLGTDGIEPLLKVCDEKDKGIYVLVKTSNKSSGELQDRLIDGIPVYAAMGDMCEKWGSGRIGEYGYSSVGAVVGATYPEQLSELRKRLPHTMFLVPGYGAQGGGAQGIAGAFDENGLGAIVNSSRAVMCAYKKEECPEQDFARAARREAERMRNDITSYINLK